VRIATVGEIMQTDLTDVSDFIIYSMLSYRNGTDRKSVRKIG